MTELLVRVQAIESAVNEIRSIVTGYPFSNARKYARVIQDNTPPWAAQVFFYLLYLYLLLYSTEARAVPALCTLTAKKPLELPFP
jgi:hypothetical protein